MGNNGWRGTKITWHPEYFRLPTGTYSPRPECKKQDLTLGVRSCFLHAEEDVASGAKRLPNVAEWG